MICLWLPKTFWLTLTNMLLGAAVAVCLLLPVAGWLCRELCERVKRRSYKTELEHDMEEMFGKRSNR